MARKMALKTKNPRCLNLWHVGFGTSNLSSLRPLQPQARDGCLATHTAVARTTNRLAREVHAFPKIRDTRQRVNGVAPPHCRWIASVFWMHGGAIRIHAPFRVHRSVEVHPLRPTSGKRLLRLPADIYR